MQNKKYWQERAERVILQSERSVLDYEKRLLRAYEIALIEIQKELDAFFGKYANQNRITYAEARKRLSVADVKTFQQQLNEWLRLAQELGMSKQYIEYLKMMSSRVYVSRLESLEANIRYEIEKLAANKHQTFTELMKDNYMASYYTTYYNMSVGVTGSVNFATIDKIGIENAIKTRWEGANYSDRIWADKLKLVQALEKLLPQSFSRGLHSNQIGDMLAKELNASKNRSRTLARTEINYLCNQSSMEVYKIAGIEKYEYLATLDMRTSEICRSLDGFVGPITQAQLGVNYPPMHPNCRSTTIPYFEEDETDDRIAKNSYGTNIKVPRRMSQEEWINKYVPENQRSKLLGFINKYKN